MSRILTTVAAAALLLAVTATPASAMPAPDSGGWEVVAEVPAPDVMPTDEPSADPATSDEPMDTATPDPTDLSTVDPNVPDPLPSETDTSGATDGTIPDNMYDEDTCPGLILFGDTAGAPCDAITAALDAGTPLDVVDTRFGVGVVLPCDMAGDPAKAVGCTP